MSIRRFWIRIIAVLPVLLLLAVRVSNCFAGTFVAYGPTGFTRTTEVPSPVGVNFAVLNPATTFTIRIDNQTVSSAIITLNGTEVFGVNDFNQQVKLLAKPVTLLSNNRLVVELRG